jgi:hypothetical protein
MATLKDDSFLLTAYHIIFQKAIKTAWSAANAPDGKCTTIPGR